MNRNALKLGAAIAALTWTATPVLAENFNVSPGDLKSALDAYARQAGVTLAYSEDAIKGVRTRGANGDLSPQAALSRILNGTGFSTRIHDGAVGIVKDPMKSSEALELPPMQLAQAAPSRPAVETAPFSTSDPFTDSTATPSPGMRECSDCRSRDGAHARFCRHRPQSGACG